MLMLNLHLKQDAAQENALETPTAKKDLPGLPTATAAR